MSQSQSMCLNPVAKTAGYVFTQMSHFVASLPLGQDVMLRSVEKRFGDRLPDTPVQWLTDNGSAYTAHETRRFARELNLEPCTTAVSSPQSNGMAERFVKTMKEDYIAFMPKPDVRTAQRNLAAAFTHYNENHPHSALRYPSPREYRRQRASLT